MRGSLETIVGAMFAGKTSELLKRILWAKHQNKQIVVIKPSLDNRYSESKIITHNDLSLECFAMQNWSDVNKVYSFKKKLNIKYKWKNIYIVLDTDWHYIMCFFRT